MQRNPRTSKRIGIYFFYDSQGIVDRYVIHFLEEIRKHLEKLVIVCNGQLTPNSREQLRQFTSHLLQRENTGWDVTAYQHALEYIGYQNLPQYDELLLMNTTFFGPLYPLEELFEQMSRRDVDFWGITSHSRIEENPFPCNGLGELPAHIQSYFIAVRRNLLASPEFESYWHSRPPINSHQDSVAFHEVLFTRHFERQGFRWATFTGTEEMERSCPNPIINIPLTLVRDRRCPIVKRRSFFVDHVEMLHYTCGEPAMELFSYLQSCLDYDVELIWENLLRCCNHSDLRRTLHLNYILPDTGTIHPQPIPIQPLRVALWLHIYYLDLVEECCSYAQNMPPDAAILITTDSPEKREEITRIFSRLPNPLEVVLIQNRGRDNSALLVGCAPYLERYDLVCFAHDKKVRQLPYEVQGKAYSNHCFENVLRSRPFVENVIRQFAATPRMGLLCPPPPTMSAYYNTVGGFDWGINYQNTCQLARRLGLTVPMDREVDPVAPFGSIFWFRTKALKPLFDQGWDYSDFPAEPVDVDGTLLHALERIYPFVAQQAGYFSGWLQSSSYAALQLTNYHYMLRQINLRLLPVCGSRDFAQLLERISRLVYPSWRMIYLPLKLFLRRVLPDKIYQRLVKVKKKVFRER